MVIGGVNIAGQIIIICVAVITFGVGFLPPDRNRPLLGDGIAPIRHIDSAEAVNTFFVFQLPGCKGSAFYPVQICFFACIFVLFKRNNVSRAHLSADAA